MFRIWLRPLLSRGQLGGVVEGGQVVARKGHAGLTSAVGRDINDIVAFHPSCAMNCAFCQMDTSLHSFQSGRQIYPFYKYILTIPMTAEL